MTDSKKTYQKLLNLISDGNFHSGEALGKQLGITRSAIWKSIKQLAKLGIEVESITGKGYRLRNKIELLNKNNIAKQLSDHSKKQIDDIVLLNQVNSTNDYLFSQAREKPERNIACLAEQQTHGKGRRGREWISPFGNNVYLSLLWHFKSAPGEIVGLSIAVATAVTKTLEQLGISNGLTLKWPNDILWKNKKLAGILLEMIAEPNNTCSVVIGIGLNTQLSDKDSARIDQPSTSVSDILEKAVSRNEISGLLLNSLVDTIEQFQRDGLQTALEEWKKYDHFAGQNVTLHTAEQNINGIMQGLGDRGELLLLNPETNQLQRHLSGRVTLRSQEPV